MTPWKVPMIRVIETITINGRDFTPQEFRELITTYYVNEGIADHAKRIAAALGVGIVVSRKEIPVVPEPARQSSPAD